VRTEESPVSLQEIRRRKELGRDLIFMGRGNGVGMVRVVHCAIRSCSLAITFHHLASDEALEKRLADHGWRKIAGAWVCRSHAKLMQFPVNYTKK
jgi:hypothetical protein